jgi:toluene monooxygenase system ferredoxin subunit
VSSSEAAGSDQVWEGEMLACTLAGRNVVLLRLDGQVRAYEDRCAHLGVRLSEGRLVGRTLTCGAHEWEYDAATGEGINPRRACLQCFPAREVDGRIFVDVEPDERDGASSSASTASSSWRTERPVGPVLEACGVTSAVLDAIREENRDVVVLERGSYVRVLNPGRLVLSAETVSRKLGRDFVLPGDLEKIMTSYRGQLSMGDGRATWSASLRGSRVE